ncbi:SGNH hydrolase domain-containing protein [Leifsonia poae]|uniref:SGNH hydrolase domain-containing protein n=1 Tax=Leifsonia poae TaxID=110933 RepID=UPI003D66A28F
MPSIAGTTIVQAKQAEDASVRAALTSDQCFGAGSMDPARDCTSATFPVLSPDPALAPQDQPDIYFTDPPCFTTGSTIVSCSFGDPDSPTRIALIGDSHAAQWQPALRALAEEHHWDLQLYLKTNCAFTEVERTEQYDACATWTAGVQKKLAAEKPMGLVITSFFAENLDLEVDKGAVSTAAAIAGFQSAWKPIVARGGTVLALRDTPHMTDGTTVCVATEGTSSSCDVARAAATARPDLQYDAAAGMDGALRTDLTDKFCTPDVCKAVIGGVAVHTDPYHMTKTYSKTLTGPLYDALRAAVHGHQVQPAIAAAFR